jgi:hypothetical protein
MPRAKRRRTRHKLARIGKFLRDNEVKPNELADVTGISRQHLTAAVRSQRAYAPSDDLADDRVPPNAWTSAASEDHGAVRPRRRPEVTNQLTHR